MHDYLLLLVEAGTVATSTKRCTGVNSQSSSNMWALMLGIIHRKSINNFSWLLLPSRQEVVLSPCGPGFTWPPWCLLTAFESVQAQWRLSWDSPRGAARAASHWLGAGAAPAAGGHSSGVWWSPCTDRRSARRREQSETKVSAGWFCNHYSPEACTHSHTDWPRNTALLHSSAGFRTSHLLIASAVPWKVPILPAGKKNHHYQQTSIFPLQQEPRLMEIALFPNISVLCIVGVCLWCASWQGTCSYSEDEKHFWSFHWNITPWGSSLPQRNVLVLKLRLLAGRCLTAFSTFVPAQVLYPTGVGDTGSAPELVIGVCDKQSGLHQKPKISLCITLPPCEISQKK